MGSGDAERTHLTRTRCLGTSTKRDVVGANGSGVGADQRATAAVVWASNGVIAHRVTVADTSAAAPVRRSRAARQGAVELDPVDA
jgi:hypothetical protein